MTKIFKIRLWLAENFGLYKYEGLIDRSNMPLARVEYPDGKNKHVYGYR